MSSCEKCWRDAHGDEHTEVAAEYARLIEERKGSPCSPEDQAGPNARKCGSCGEMTAHQWTGECMTPDCAGKAEQ